MATQERAATTTAAAAQHIATPVAAKERIMSILDALTDWLADLFGGAAEQDSGSGPARFQGGDPPAQGSWGSGADITAGSSSDAMMAEINSITDRAGEHYKGGEGAVSDVPSSTQAVHSMTNRALSDAYSITQDPSPENIAAHRPPSYPGLEAEVARGEIENSVRESESKLQESKQDHQLALDANETLIHGDSVSKQADKLISDTKSDLG